jgi:hypothetical protein
MAALNPPEVADQLTSVEPADPAAPASRYAPGVFGCSDYNHRRHLPKILNFPYSSKIAENSQSIEN